MKSVQINVTPAIKLFSLTLIFSILATFQHASAQLFFADVEGSQVKISGSKNNTQFAPITSHFSCEGNFTMTNGELQYLNELKFNLPINTKNKQQNLVNPALLNTTTPTSDINFELTHSMVLPQLNMIHAIGYLNIQGVRTRVDFHLDYIENNSETITVMGKRSIKLSDYKKNFTSIFADAKTQDIIQLDLKLVIKNPVKAEFIASIEK